MQNFPGPRFISSLIQLWLKEAENKSRILKMKIDCNNCYVKQNQKNFNTGLKQLQKVKNCSEVSALNLVKMMKISPACIATFYNINQRLPEVAELSFLRAVGFQFYIQMVFKGICLTPRNSANNCLLDETEIVKKYSL